MKNILIDIIEAEVNENLPELTLIEKKIKRLINYTKLNIEARVHCWGEKQRLRTELKEYKELLHLIYQKKERVNNILTN